MEDNSMVSGQYTLTGKRNKLGFTKQALTSECYICHGKECDWFIHLHNCPPIHSFTSSERRSQEAQIVNSKYN